MSSVVFEHDTLLLGRIHIHRDALYSLFNL